jgi:hypothetical protein
VTANVGCYPPCCACDTPPAPRAAPKLAAPVLVVSLLTAGANSSACPLQALDPPKHAHAQTHGMCTRALRCRCFSPRGGLTCACTVSRKKATMSSFSFHSL